MSEKFLIIADDLTGANDTGVQFTKRGIPSQVVFKAAGIESNDGAVVIDSETRGMDGQEAYERVKELCRAVQIDSFSLVYKKLDSTLRGNVSEEIKAVYEIYKPELVIFAPAYPDSHRTTVNGIQHMKGVPVSQTEVGRDPKKPVTEDNITNILQRAIGGEVTHIFLEDIRSSKMDLSKGIAYTFDAEETEDLIKIAERVKLENKKTLWIGSAGLADAISNQILVPLKDFKDSIWEVNISSKPVLSIIGSISEVSGGQVIYAASKGAKVIKVHIGRILKDNDISEVVIESVKNLKDGKDTILVSSLSREDYEECIKLASEWGMTKEEMSVFTQLTLGRIAEKILKQAGVSGLFLTGGDTAIEVIRKIEGEGTKILQELMVGIPLMKLMGGPFDGLPVVTKAGAFGEKYALHYCINRLKGSSL